MALSHRSTYKLQLSDDILDGAVHNLCRHHHFSSHFLDGVGPIEVCAIVRLCESPLDGGGSAATLRLAAARAVPGCAGNEWLSLLTK